MYLLQVPVTKEEINNWYPLYSKEKISYNCSATVLCLMNIQPRELAQYYATIFETNQYGASQENVLFMMKEAAALSYDVTQSISLPIEFIYDTILAQLYNNHITIVALYGIPERNAPDHITAIIRTDTGNLIIFEGQSKKYFINTQIDEYLADYHSFHVYYYNTIENISKETKRHTKSKRNNISSTAVSIRKKKQSSPITKKLKHTNN